MKVKVEVLFFLFAFEFQCVNGDTETLQKYKNQRTYLAEEIHMKVEFKVVF